MSTGVKLAGKKVLVALTGRVDSAVAAFLLKKQGMQVYGLSILTSSEDIVQKTEHLPQCHISNLDSIRIFCESIGIPFYATDAKSMYEGIVIDNLMSNKLTARANSSCFDCTKMRMKVLFTKMKHLKMDFIATGHYAKVHKNLNSNRFFIHTNNDPTADQSLLLAGLDNEILSHLLLPLGELKKSDVQKIASSFQLNVLANKEQNSFCFRDPESIKVLVKKYIPPSLIKPGIMLNKESINVGDHDSVVYHYISQNKLQVTSSGGQVDKNLEIVDYDYHNAIIQLGDKRELTFMGAEIVHLLLGQGVEKSRPINCFVKFKHSSKYYGAILFFKNNDAGLLEFKEEVYPLVTAETMILYDSDARNSKVIGTGKVGKRGTFKLTDRVHEFRKTEIGEHGDVIVTGEVTMFRF